MRTITFLLCITAAAALGEPPKPPFFAVFMAETPPNNRLGEMKAAQVKSFFEEHGFPDGIPLQSGGMIEYKTITSLSPAGIKVMTNNGIELWDWEGLRPAIVELMGWTPEARARYLKQAKMETASIQQEAFDAQYGRPAKSSVSERRKESTGKEDPFALYLPVDPRGEIRARAAKDWPDSFTMQEFAIKSETEAFIKMRGYCRDGMPGIPWSVFKGIAAKAISDWPNSYHMMVFSTEKEGEAWKRLHGGAP